MATAYEVQYPNDMVRASRNRDSKLDRVDDPLRGGLHRRLREGETDPVRTLDVRDRLRAGLEAEALVRVSVSRLHIDRREKASARTPGGLLRASERAPARSVGPLPVQSINRNRKMAFSPERLSSALHLGGLTAREAAVRTWTRINDHEILTRAAAITFYAIAALVPFMALIISLTVQSLPMDHA